MLGSTIAIRGIFVILFLPESRGDVGEVVANSTLVKALVGGALLQATKVLYVRTKLDVVEVALAYRLRKLLSTAVPRHLNVLVLTVQILCKLANVLRVGIAAHKANAGYLAAILLHKLVEHHWGEWLTYVFPQIVAVATRTTAWAACDVDRQRHLVGYFLEYNSCIEII